MEYIAFGEVLFEEHSSSFSSPYLFNGKELDRETNTSYYGARYLDMKTSLWLSGDKYSENDLSVGSYVYSFNNPINLTDPDGNWPDFPSWGNSLFNNAKSATRNYVAGKVGNVVSNMQNYAHQKSKGLLNAMTPSNPFRIGKSETTGGGRDSHGGYDFRSDFRKGEDSSGKVQKDRGQNNTEVVDISGIDALSTFVGFSTGTKTISKSGKIVDVLTDFVKAVQATPNGWFISQNAGDMINQETIEITNTFYSNTYNPTTNNHDVTERVSVPKDTVINTKDKSQVLLNQKRKNEERRNQEQRKLE